MGPICAKKVARSSFRSLLKGKIHQNDCLVDGVLQFVSDHGLTIGVPMMLKGENVENLGRVE